MFQRYSYNSCKLTFLLWLCNGFAHQGMRKQVNLLLILTLHNTRYPNPQTLDRRQECAYIGKVFDDVHLFIHSLVFIMRDPYTLPKRVLHTVRSSASSFNFQYPLLSLRIPSSCLRLLHFLTVTSITPNNFALIICFIR